VLELLPPILHLRPPADREWPETILQRMVTEAALQRPGQLAVLSRMTEVLFVGVELKFVSPCRGRSIGARFVPFYWSKLVERVTVSH
jgi:Cupin